MNENYIVYGGELYHHGVKGMKWGVRRAKRKMASNEKLERKAYVYDKKAAKYRLKAEQAHNKYDLGSSNKKALKSAKYDMKAAKLHKKALNADDSTKMKLENKAAKLSYKAAKNKTAADRIALGTPYGKKAIKLMAKSDEVAAKAAKARSKMANNKRYISTMKKRVSELSPEELRDRYAFAADFT
jgi:hypothetical protein